MRHRGWIDGFRKGSTHLRALLGKTEQTLDLIQTSEEADAKQAY
nr:hypothetical protein [Bradyrhizobium yuanmingense]